MHSTNYRDTLITVSADCPVPGGTIPEKPGTIATVQHGLLATPYAMTSDDLLYATHRARGGGKRREEFFATPQACLRASPLVKQFGWGIHHDGEGRIALLDSQGADYRRLLDDASVKKTPGMRSKR
ncbi:hypothetical protein FHS95_004037 [Sphingomonas naasensis]|uniref:Uncharacterized protein n=1 Tax=Sphingomonas naasensis TaxID=1344951 RepID=A0A4S1WEY5_9SPHN|nr:DUF6157 family protein [Sphingomonas naasensis]NIJ22322.1 hypothetical protein [Sphingomonas naasensis]TGX40675.1 hypothetical protein E5A74_14340 [Sphingomonas naasensis]